MTRKRFIKLLMSKGVQRNQAAKIAREVREYGVVGLSYNAASHGVFIGKGKEVKYSLNLSFEEFADFSIRRNRYAAKHDILYLPIYKEIVERQRKIIEIFNPAVRNEEEYKRYNYWLRSPCTPTSDFAFAGVVPCFCI